MVISLTIVLHKYLVFIVLLVKNNNEVIPLPVSDALPLPDLGTVNKRHG